jgi:putative toxin-antitoxin system antitoxin component (TIGR02293 family)
VSQSEQAELRTSRIFARAVDFFEGDRDAASEWMLSPLPGLGGATPSDAAKTEIGARNVENLICRMEHGVYS